jgi:hypothetical protein
MRDKHGFKGTRFYRMWGAMKDRCFNPNCANYYNYGGRGITVSDDWKRFVNFKNDLIEKYNDGCIEFGEKNTTIERIANNKGYYKGNVIFIHKRDQMNNRRCNIMFNGECAQRASVRLGGNRKIVADRIKSGWSKEKAFTTPKKVIHNKNI